MSTSINNLARGGYSTYGSSWYDPRADVVLLQAHDAEIVPITVSYPSAISTVNYDTDGIETTEPTISSTTFTATLSNFNAGDRIRYDVLLSTGEMRHLNIEISGASTRNRIMSPGGDYGTFA